MRVAKGSVAERISRNDEARLKLEKERDDLMHEAALDLGRLVIDAGGLNVDRVQLVAAVRSLSGTDAGEGSAKGRRKTQA